MILVITNTCGPDGNGYEFTKMKPGIASFLEKVSSLLAYLNDTVSSLCEQYQRINQVVQQSISNGSGSGLTDR